MKKVLKSLLCFVLILAMSVPVFAANSTDKGLSDEPYDYGLVPYSEEWDKLSTPERKAIFVIPEEVAKGLTTRALLETILNNPYILDVFAYETADKGLEIKNKVLCLDILKERNDVFSVILIKKIEINNLLKVYEQEFERNISMQKFYALYEEDFDFFTNIVFENMEFFELYLKKDFLNVLSNYFSNLFVLSYYDDGFPDNQHIEIQTPMQTFITVVINATWSQWATLNNDSLSYNAIASAIKDAQFVIDYGVEKIGNSNPSYNCHSYALYSTSSSNNVWIFDSRVSPFYEDGSYVQKYTPSVGNILTYSLTLYDYYHSAVIESVSPNLVLVSKWGQRGVFRHGWMNCPYYEDYSYPIIRFWE